MNSFVTDLAGDNGKGNPNEKIKITLSGKEDETPKSGGKGRKR